MKLFTSVAGAVLFCLTVFGLLFEILLPAVEYDDALDKVTSGEVLDKYTTNGLLGMGGTQYKLEIDASSVEKPDFFSWLYDDSVVFTVSEDEFNSVKVGDTFVK